jgi:AcrB/AcrD/AcrF family
MATHSQSANTARFFIALKPREERTLTASQIINRLRPQFARVEGANMFLQPTQDITVGGRAARGSFQYTLQDANIPELVEWSQKLLDKMRTLPQLADASTDLLAIAPRLRVTINRDQASRFGITPQMIDEGSVRSPNTSPSSIPTGSSSKSPAGHLRFARTHLREIAADRLSAAAVGARHRRYHQGRPAFGVAPGPVPGGYAVVQPASRHWRCGPVKWSCR